MEEGIGDGVFSDCTSLKQVNIPRMQIISDSMFSGCSNLSNIKLPDCVFYICSSAFSNCSKLKEIVIPNNVEIIWNEAFKSCSSLTEVIMPKGISSIESNAFENCNENLTFKLYKNSYAETYANENNIKIDFISPMGDVDENGVVDANDAVIILKYVAHNIELTDEQFLLGNINGDEYVDAEDAVLILKYVAHNIELEDVIPYEYEKLDWPLPTVYARHQFITSYFGPRKRPTAGASTNHGAIDIGVAYQPVYAAEAGTVVMAQYVSGYGNFIMLWHNEMGQLYTCYGHLNSFKVSTGQKVSRGQQIAVSGNTGISTGPHLHFEVRAGGSSSRNRVEPLKYVKVY